MTEGAGGHAAAEHQLQVQYALVLHLACQGFSQRQARYIAAVATQRDAGLPGCIEQAKT